MSSLSGMKEALKDSLTRQWDAQQQKKEQLAALTHDIKTPLTVIKGNAELLAETDLSAETGSVRMLFWRMWAAWSSIWSICGNCCMDVTAQRRQK